MSLVKVGKYYWPDIRIKGKRIRRSLRTGNKLEALYRFKEARDNLLAEHDAGDKIRFSDFCRKYLDWAWVSKPKVAPKEQQRLRKIQYFFEGLKVFYLEDITPYQIEKLKADLLMRGLKKSTATAGCKFSVACSTGQ